MSLLLALALAAAAAPARAQDAAVPPDAAPPPENPLVPIIRELGRRAGVKLGVGRVAINPFKATIVLRDLEASSALQGSFLSADRVEIQGDLQSKTQEVEAVDVETAKLALDLARPGVSDKKLSGAHPGKLRRATIKNLSLRLSANGARLLAGEGLGLRAANVTLCPSQGVLPICGRLELFQGSIRLLGGTSEITEVTLLGEMIGQRLKVQELTGRLGGGRILCDGEVSFFAGGAKSKGSDLRCRLNDVRIQRGEVLDVVVDGEVRLRGTPVKLKLTGDLIAVGGTVLRSGTWKAADAASPVETDLTLRVKAPKGRAAARVTADKGLGRVTLLGPKHRDPHGAEKLLRQLPPPSADRGEP